MNKQFVYIVDAVRAMQPGHDLRFAREIWYGLTPPPPFSPQDWVLEQIIGSGYEYSYRQDAETGNWVFRRRKSPCDANHRTYVSPDRLRYVNKIDDGWYELKNKG